MGKFFRELFDDENTINEKSVIGFLSFVVMVVFASVDIVTGYFGQDLVINDFIFNAFLFLCLGAFGFGSVDKFINNKKEMVALKSSILFLLISTVAFAQDITIGSIKNNIEMGPLAGNRDLAFGVKNILEEVLQEKT